jgi:hypothetical protein
MGAIPHRNGHERGWDVIGAGTGLLMPGTAIGTLGVQAQTSPQMDQAHG